MYMSAFTCRHLVVLPAPAIKEFMW